MTPDEALTEAFAEGDPGCEGAADAAAVMRDRLAARGFAVLPIEAAPCMVQAWRKERGTNSGPKRLWEIMVRAARG